MLDKITNWTIAGSEAHHKSYPIYLGTTTVSVPLPDGSEFTNEIKIFRAIVKIGETEHQVVEKTYNAAFDAIKALRAEYREERGLTGTSARDRFANRLAVMTGKLASFEKAFDLPENLSEKVETAREALTELEAAALAAFDAGNVDRAAKDKTGTDE